MNTRMVPCCLQLPLSKYRSPVSSTSGGLRYDSALSIVRASRAPALNREVDNVTRVGSDLLLPSDTGRRTTTALRKDRLDGIRDLSSCQGYSGSRSPINNADLS
jgi:hypothetical protein